MFRKNGRNCLEKEKYRGNRIWTCDLTAPSRARYQATPYPDKTDLYKIETIICIIMAFVNNYLIFKIALKIDKIHSDKTLSYKPVDNLPVSMVEFNL